jgi:regulator of extracellular matrix RemA (YlzA/DUF370 family)
MTNLPKSTYFNKIIAKEKIYTHGIVDAELERLFVEQVNRIRWLHKISVETINISRGDKVEEIQVIEVNLRKPAPDKRILSAIKKAIPYSIIFVLVYNTTTSYVIVYDTDTIFESDTEPKLIGSNTDSIWENFIIQIGGIEIADGRTLDEQIALNKERDKIIRNINKLEMKAMNEKQPRRKWEIVEDVRKMKTVMEDLM